MRVLTPDRRVIGETPKDAFTLSAHGFIDGVYPMRHRENGGRRDLSVPRPAAHDRRGCSSGDVVCDRGNRDGMESGDRDEDGEAVWSHRQNRATRRHGSARSECF
jgi:hypothetical protein